ncbi:MAG: UDP-3-O-(3-hydroxymyristoyl)glucosamine N-acyltransferase [Alphaproteobacteria bacterium]|nr:UDP-3-O-(3-hydroxymyristoyl)glucosamine N-acyltransferase [Alphaproteobacteria bacterium]MBN2779889.1 UDP-3-O-(3-hydroxymyristoyl)glucosamine N-acyltransferase [Alphaproteobacteria bacterium]
MSSFSLKDLAKKLGGNLVNVSDDSCVLTGCASLKTAGPSDLCYFDTHSFTRQDLKKLNAELAQTKAGLILIDQVVEDSDKSFLIVEKPKNVFQKALSLFYVKEKKTGISTTAVIDKFVVFEDRRSVYIADYVVLKSGVKIGKNVVLESHVTVDTDCEIGSDTHVEAHASIRSATIGKDCWIGPGVRIGFRGFGYASSEKGHAFVPHIGRVVIGDHVDIGANTCVDRGMLDDTIIEDGTKLDDLIIVGHGCKIGKNCLLAAQTGMAGGTVLKDFVFTGGQVGFGGHLVVESGTHIAGQAGVISHLSRGVYMGFPAELRTQFLRKQVALKKLLEKKEEK